MKRAMMVGALLFVGCGTTPPLDRYTETEQARVDDFCGRCWVSGSWDSPEQCRGNDPSYDSQAFYGDLDAEELACMQERYVASAELDDALLCLVDAMEEWIRCDASCQNVETDEVSSDCYDEYYPREEACLADDAIREQVDNIRSCASP